MSSAHYVIIGNSAAAVGAVTGIRSVDAEGPIRLLARESEHTYSRPLISYLLGGKVGDDRMDYRPRDFYERNRVEAVLGMAATGLDLAAREVVAADGRRFRFDRLLIATGGRPVVPRDVPGLDAEGVFTLTTWDDARRIREHIARRAVKSAVVVGGGLIGLKSVEALQALGIATTVVELADRLLSATFDRTASELARAAMEKSGVSVRCGTTVTEVLVSGGAVSGARLKDGSRLDCGLVIVAIGVLPALSLVAGTGIATDRGILVDSTLATSAPGVWAAGDVAQAPDLFGRGQRCVPILPGAFRQGFIAGVNMAGQRRDYRGSFFMNAVEVLGLPTVSVGMTDPAPGDGCEVLSEVDRPGGRYKKLVLQGGRIVGAIFVGQIDRAGIVTNLIRSKVDVSGIRDHLLSGDFGLLSLPAEYRKHMVRGAGIEV